MTENILREEDLRCPECGPVETDYKADHMGAGGPSYRLDLIDWSEEAAYFICLKCGQQWSVGPL